MRGRAGARGRAAGGRGRGARCGAGKFHEEAMRAGPAPAGAPRGPPADLAVRPCRAAELGGASLVRAWSLKRYMPGREWSSRRDREGRTSVETARLEELYAGKPEAVCETEICLVASTSDPGIVAELSADTEPGGLAGLVGADGTALVGTLDVSLEAQGDQYLFPGSECPAYISSMGVVEAARRRGVASALLEGARTAAADLGAAGLFVVTMAVNERARALYAAHGFKLVKEESVDKATRRGGCLDGEEGKARTVLLVDSGFRPKRQ